MLSAMLRGGLAFLAVSAFWAASDAAVGGGVCTIQLALAAAGYDPGPIDCAGGPRTRAALEAFTRDGGLQGQPASVVAQGLTHARAFIPCRKSGADVRECIARVSGSATPKGARPGRPAPRQSFSSPCDDANASCQSGCADELFDYETGEWIESSDFESECEDACASGASACEDADRDDRGDEFRSACEGDCPSDFFDTRRGEFRLLTSADEVCSAACDSGASEVD